MTENDLVFDFAHLNTTVERLYKLQTIVLNKETDIMIRSVDAYPDAESGRTGWATGLYYERHPRYGVRATGIELPEFDARGLTPERREALLNS